MAIKILQIQQNSEKWLKEREKYVTGSNADILLTQGIDQALARNMSRFNGNYFTQRGHILEEEAIEIYEAVNHVTVDRPGMVINDRYPNGACSPDGIDQEFLIEVKCFASKKHMEILTVSMIPFKIMSQLQFNMMICELKKAKLVMYNPDIENNKLAYRELIVRADKAAHANFKAKLEAQR